MSLTFWRTVVVAFCSVIVMVDVVVVAAAPMHEHADDTSEEAYVVWACRFSLGVSEVALEVAEVMLGVPPVTQVPEA